MRRPEQANGETRRGFVAAGARGREAGVTTTACVVSLRGNELVLKLLVVTVAQRGEYTNHHWIMTFKTVGFVAPGDTQL